VKQTLKLAGYGKNGRAIRRGCVQTGRIRGTLSPKTVVSAVKSIVPPRFGANQSRKRAGCLVR
jgi:hypothetical protein